MGDRVPDLCRYGFDPFAPTSHDDRAIVQKKGTVGAQLGRQIIQVIGAQRVAAEYIHPLEGANGIATAATKAGTLGAGLLMIAEAFYYRQMGVSLRAATVIALLLLTAPVAAHLIGRASYRSGVALSDRTWIDELKNQPDGF